MTVRWSRDRAHIEFEKAPRSQLAASLLPYRRRLRAAAHELRCPECRVTWRSWWRRLIGDKRGFAPLGPIPHQYQEWDDPPPPGRGITIHDGSED